MDQPSPAAAARLIQVVLLSGVVAFAIVIGVITNGADPIGDPSLQGPIAWVGGALAVVCSGVAFFLRKVMPARIARVTVLSARERAMRAALLPAATLEAAMLFNLVGWLVRNDPWPTAAFALLPFCVAVAFLIQPIELEEPRQ